MIGSNGHEFADCGHPWVTNANGVVLAQCDIADPDYASKPARRRGKDRKRNKPAAETMTRAPVLGTVPVRTSEAA